MEPKKPMEPEECGENPEGHTRPEEAFREHPHHHRFFRDKMEGMKIEHRHFPPKMPFFPPFFAPFPPMEFKHHEFDFYLSLAHELSLSDEQVKKLQSIKFECEKSRIMIKARIKVGEMELQELLNQPEVDIEKVDEKIKEIGEIKIEDSINDIHALIDAKNVLTTEQKERLKKLIPFPFNGHC